jgi:N-hydroxyarylamine O-acetyltransferase
MNLPDLDAYFARIGYTGPREPSLATLRAIHERHALTFPFENLDVVLGRGISLDLGAIQKKFLVDRRGGYCFEQNSLLGAVLRALGFNVTTLIARVRWQVPADVPTGQTHMVLRVDLDGRPWLADGGFGGYGLVVPLALDTAAEQIVRGETRRIVTDGRLHTQQVLVASEWVEAYRFTLDPMQPIDFEIANWYTSTHPQSRFRQNLIAALPKADRRIAILNRDFITRWPDGRADKSPIDSPAHLLAILAEHFDLHFPADTHFGPPDSPWPS